MKDLYTIIIKPYLTEKSMVLKESENKLIVEVSTDANKVEIKKAFETIFKVKVEKVATIRSDGKLKRYGRSYGRTSKKKKAIITLQKGQTLDFVEGMH
ncbi:MAG: 50S ribosomal protein L23 [Nitrospirae bacterium]|nr:50S ribosomal protein L23 [Nitrospirota bacterium]MBF0541538.1 50S ribosomal protein L23 [Nitrospirota bacterium]